MQEGSYPVVGGGVKPLGAHSTFNTPAGAICISGGGAAGYVSRYNVPIYRAAVCYEVVPTIEIEISYLFHALKLAQAELLTLRYGVSTPYLHKDQFYAFNIPLPTLETQRLIAAELDNLDINTKSAIACIGANIKKTLALAITGGAPTLEKKELSLIGITSNTCNMEYDYLYCLSNEAMPGIVRICISSKTPDQAINDLNSEDAPHDYKIMFAKKVSHPMEKLKSLRTLMANDRTHPNRDFFRTPLEHIKLIFDLMSGEPWG